MVKFNRSVFKRFVAGQDWGFTNPGVLSIWGVDWDGRMLLVHEHYRSQRQIGWWVEKAKEAHTLFGLEAIAADPSEPAFIAAYTAARLPAIKAFNDILPGLHAVMARLTKAGDGRPRLAIWDEALAERDEHLAEISKPVCTADEFELYCLPKSRDGSPVKELPVDENNHGMDAMRYAVAYVDRLKLEIDKTLTREASPLANHRGGGKTTSRPTGMSRGRY
jgi:hypothetical protein